MAKVKVSKKFQIAVPSEIRKKLGIRAGDTLIIDVQGEHAVLLREPEDWAEKFFGLHKEVWEGIDVDEYIREERAAWRESPTL